MKQIDVVAGVIFNDAGTAVLLALRKPEQHQGDRWEFPGGKLEEGESLDAALVRELQEEIGIVVGQSQSRCIVEHQYTDKSVRLHFQDVTQFSGEPQGREGQQLRWVPLPELDQLRFPDANQVVVNSLLAQI